MSEVATKAKLERLTLKQDTDGYTGVEFALIAAQYARKDKPWRLTMFANQHGCMEVSFDMTPGDAEAMRDWLNDFLAHT